MDAGRAIVIMRIIPQWLKHGWGISRRLTKYLVVRVHHTMSVLGRCILHRIDLVCLLTSNRSAVDLCAIEKPTRNSPNMRGCLRVRNLKLLGVNLSVNCGSGYGQKEHANESRADPVGQSFCAVRVAFCMELAYQDQTDRPIRRFNP